MQPIDIARRCAELNAVSEANNAYILALHQGELIPEERLEAAVYLLRMGGNYRIAYTQFAQLYNEGQFQEQCLDIMTDAFYYPNVKLMKNRYEKNCAALKKYPYLFRSDFPKFEELPLRFYPFDDNGYLPFNPQNSSFGEYVNFNHPVVSHNFFKNLENPILARDVYSQYELEYLYDNVRPSEDIGQENHLYLYYENWKDFCAHLQVLNVRHILGTKKVVFLFEDEISRYPIDFKKMYGIDYNQYSVKPIRIQDVHRLIWHTQLSSSNGGDFFNEVFDNHPNLICLPSIMMENIEESIQHYREEFDKADKLRSSGVSAISFGNAKAEALYWSGRRTDKDILTSMFMAQDAFMGGLDHTARIYPALFFQPHFGNINYDLFPDEKGRTIIQSDVYDKIRISPIFKAFKYIKTFTPMRRVTTTYASTIRWMIEKRSHITEVDGKKVVISDLVADRVSNRSFMIDPEDRLYKDSVLVRFEDGKTNPQATFTALAEFLDIPYTESMTYCSEKGIHDVETAEGNVVGFDTATVYRTYDDYGTNEERAYIEFCLRDAYQFYGYDLHYYDGTPVDEERLNGWLKGFGNIDERIADSWRNNVLSDAKALIRINGEEVENDVDEIMKEQILDNIKSENNDIRFRIGKAMIDGLYFVNKNGQPLRMMPKLELDPALLDQPLYH